VAFRTRWSSYRKTEGFPRAAGATRVFLPNDRGAAFGDALSEGRRQPATWEVLTNETKFILCGGWTRSRLSLNEALRSESFSFFWHYRNLGEAGTNSE